VGRDGPPAAAGHGTTAVAAHVPVAPVPVARTRAAHALGVHDLVAAAHVRVGPAPVDHGSRATVIRAIRVKGAVAPGVAATVVVVAMAAGAATTADVAVMVSASRVGMGCAATAMGHAASGSTTRCRRVADRERGAGAAVDARSRSFWNCCASCSS